MNRTILIIILIVGVGVIGGMIFLLTGTFTSQDEEVVNTNTTTVTETTNQAVEVTTPLSDQIGEGLEGNQVTVAPLTDDELNDREVIRQKALRYATTYGTFSNQNENDHLKALLNETTSPLVETFNESIANTTIAEVGQYQGFTSTAVSVNIQNITSVTATAIVSTRRVESVDSLDADRTFNQDLTLIFKKVGENWQVAEADWQEEEEA
ncbi:hypothetical protein ACFL04_03730 [Patescibacteria group bacterium]